ncbi:MAG: DUF1330 domain-containing protein [Brevundimonas sp.]
MIEFVDPARDALAAFRELPDDRPIMMLNLIRYRPRAIYPAAHPLIGEEISGKEAYARYRREAATPFARAGGEQIWAGLPELTVIGPRHENWDLAFIARYPSGAAFTAMLKDPEYQAAVPHRQAGVADSRLIRCGEPGR